MKRKVSEERHLWVATKEHTSDLQKVHAHQKRLSWLQSLPLLLENLFPCHRMLGWKHLGISIFLKSISSYHFLSPFYMLDNGLNALHALPYNIIINLDYFNPVL